MYRKKLSFVGLLFKLSGIYQSLKMHPLWIKGHHWIYISSSRVKRKDVGAGGWLPRSFSCGAPGGLFFIIC